MLAQNRLVFFSLHLLQFIANHHRLTAEHAVELLYTGLEQGPRISPGGFHIGAWCTLSPEHKLEHGYPSEFPNGSVFMIAEIVKESSQHTLRTPHRQKYVQIANN